jgi:hypothetical protein
MNTEQRLAQLERQLRWLKRLGVLAVAVGAVVVLGGQAKEKGLPDLKVRSLQVIDRDGTTRCVLASDSAGDGRTGLFIQYGLAERVALYARKDLAVLAIEDMKERTSVSLRVDPEVRLDRGGGTTLAGVPSLRFFDQTGKVIWKAPGE